jgi:hypothetical protein
MAVAPDSSWAKRESRVFMVLILVCCMSRRGGSDLEYFKPALRPGVEYRYAPERRSELFSLTT